MVGVPEIAPVVELMVNHGGTLPTAAKLYGGAPPVAVQLPAYATPTCAVNGAEQPMLNAVPETH